MKRFIASSIIFTIICCSIIVAIELSFRSIPNNYSFKYQYLNNHAEHIQIINLGSSLELDGINPKLFHRQAFNAALSAQSPEFDYYFFDKFYCSLDSLKVLILPWSYSSLRQGTLPYGIYLFEYYNKCGFSAPYLKFKQRFAISTYSLEKVVKILTMRILKGDFSMVTVDSLGWECWEDNYANWEDSKQREHAWRFGNEMKKVCGDGTVCNAETYAAIISRCKARSIHVILLSTPLTGLFIQELDGNQLESVISEGYEYQEKYDNVTYLNMFSNPRFPDSLFFNSDHLNARGATLLTNIVDSIIENHILSINSQ